MFTICRNVWGSGQNENIDKTLGIWIGRKLFSSEDLLPELKLDRKFRLLGIEFNLNNSDVTECNYANKLKNIKNLLKNWRFRTLTILGKITVVKSLALSMLVHLFMALPSPSKEWLAELENLFF